MKTILITGPTSGIGKAIAFGLAASGVRLVLACRDIQRGEVTAAELSQRTSAAQVEVMQIDTSSQQSIRDFARKFLEQHARLDILVNNAGINSGTLGRQESVDGIELTFATNVMGYFLLTGELLDLIRASAPARIVNVASAFASAPVLDDLQFKHRPYDPTQAYTQSKACNRLLTWALARRLAGTQVSANAMAPGFVPETGLFRHAAPESRAGMRQRGGRSIEQGADTAVWLASSPELDGVSGKFYYDRGERPCEFRDAALEERLWSICEELRIPRT